MKASRRFLFVLLTGLIGLAIAELASYAVVFVFSGDPRFSFEPVAQRLDEQTRYLHALLDDSTERLLQLDPELGWIYAPAVSSGPYSSTTQGLRGTRLYPEVKKSGSLRVAAFGDSFVHGNEVGDEEAWARQLETLDADIEVLNYGVGGYGTDQALLLYQRRGREFDPDVVVLGFTEVSYARNVNRYRRFRAATEMPLFKPRFLLGEDGGLELLPNPFPGPEAARRLIDDPWAILEAAPSDWFFEPLIWRNPLYDWSALVRVTSTLLSKIWISRLKPGQLYRGGLMNEDSEAFALQVALIREFERRVREAGARLLVVVFPRDPSDLWGEAPRAYEPLVAALDDLWLVDLADALGPRFRGDRSSLFAPGGHYSAAGNRAVAEALLQALRRQGAAPATR